MTERQRVHRCPECGQGCNCEKGWRALDAEPSRELWMVRPEECDCEHEPTGQPFGARMVADLRDDVRLVLQQLAEQRQLMGSMETRLRALEQVRH